MLQHRHPRHIINIMHNTTHTINPHILFVKDSRQLKYKTRHNCTYNMATIYYQPPYIVINRGKQLNRALRQENLVYLSILKYILILLYYWSPTYCSYKKHTRHKANQSRTTCYTYTYIKLLSLLLILSTPIYCSLKLYKHQGFRVK